MTGDELRELYLKFFEERGHLRVPSSSLVPLGDPTLLLTSAGMVQFKPYFTGEAVPPNPRLTSCQKCFRTTDVEAVGDNRHLTFFEMLGNFSVGDYFKKEAIGWAWEFVTRYLHLSPERLWVTIFQDDEESLAHWRALGVPQEKIWRFGEGDNFWGPAGDSGPCGPCSEIHYDHDPQSPCGPTCGPNCANPNCKRFVEIWNLVFTQYFQDVQGKRTPLPRPNIDTGMGLERVAAALQEKRTCYETELFAPIIKRISELCGKTYGQDREVDGEVEVDWEDRKGRAFRVVAEHGRAVTFLVADGVIPSNEGRGYVLRRVLRRAALFGRKLGLKPPYLPEVAKVVIARMKHAYPELARSQGFILQVLEQEEERFKGTLATGLAINTGVIEYRKLFGSAIPELVSFLKENRPTADNAGAVLEQYGFVGGTGESGEELGTQLAADDISKLTHEALEAFEKSVRVPSAEAESLLNRILAWPTTISGGEAFTLYDTYGFPKELTTELAKERGFQVDLEGFERAMEGQRERARAARKTGKGEAALMQDYSALSLPAAEFVGYERLSCRAMVLSLAPEPLVGEGQEVEVVLDRTPFYAEMGGQVTDTGWLLSRAGEVEVTEAVWATHEVVAHRGRVIRGHIAQGEEVKVEVDRERRLDIARNHTATHLLQAALRQVLGAHVRQMGSLVAPDRLRFDFTHLAALSQDELHKIQGLVNQAVRQDMSVRKRETSYPQAVAEGATALFGEKYGETVRTVKIGPGRAPFSYEVCGGTHLSHTGQTGLFRITSETSIGAGLRRLEAVTGRGAEALVQSRLGALEEVASRLGAAPQEVPAKVASLLDELEGERRRVAALEREQGKRAAEALLAQVQSVDGVSVIAARVSATSFDTLREMGDWLKSRLQSGVVVLGAIWDDRPNFVAMVTPDLVQRGFHAGNIVREVAAVAGGGGGGRPNIGQ
ncbi:MAG: alanine--tRNA ligase, partial [Chloroflexota bacterium]|nr:alanine--tRNA ligase [Chloroflexota bacterium]